MALDAYVYMHTDARIHTRLEAKWASRSGWMSDAMMLDASTHTKLVRIFPIRVVFAPNRLVEWIERI